MEEASLVVIEESDVKYQKGNNLKIIWPFKSDNLSGLASDCVR